MSTSRWNFCRKSTPRMWKSTAAKRKDQVYRRPFKLMVSRRRPQQGILWPPADLRRGPDGGSDEVKGRMLNEEPVSTRKDAPLMSSLT